MKGNTQPKEILFVTLHLTDGGAERVASVLIGEWVRKGCKVTVVQIAPEMFSNSYSMPNEIEYVNFSFDNNKYVKFIKRVKSLVSVMKQHPDATVVCFAKSTIFVAGLASIFTSNRLVLSERNDPYKTPPSKMGRVLRDWLFRHADACVFQTFDARDYFPQEVRDKSVVIPNPMNESLPKRFEGNREATIVAAGRLVPQKNFAMLIKAFALLHGEFPEYRLVIYGRGPLEAELKELSAALGVAEFTVFPGFSDSIFEDMQRCAVYVSSSDYEGMSNSMLEALGMGIPSVVTDCPIGGARMVIKNNVNGILVPVGDEKAMCEGIKKVLSDANFAESLSKEAVKLRDELKVQDIADRWLEVI